MQINIVYNSSVNNAPAAFETDVNIAVQYLESLFTNPITITIDVGYGEIDGQSLGSNDLGESEASQYVIESYSAVRNALIAEDAPRSSTLPTTSPFSGSLAMSQAEAKALGLPENNLSIDGYVGFSSTSGIFGYANNIAPPSNEYYFIGVVEHEITEDMGRVSLLNDQPNYYAPIDLYRYSSSGVRDLTTGGNGSTAYFSINNGTTNLGSWNNNPSNGDLADWYGNNIPNNGYDAFDDYSNPGVVNIFSQSDITLMEALGWTTSSESSPQWTLVATGDFTGNGITDFLWENNSTGQTDEWLSSANGGIGSSVWLPSVQGWTLVATGDFTGNGITDFLWENNSTSQTDEWLMSANGGIGSSVWLPSVQGWTLLATGDFTGNGITDFLWENNSTSQTDEWLMSANGGIGSSVWLPSVQGWTLLATGDFTGHGITDFLWENNSTSQTDEWLMSANGGIGSSVWLPSVQGWTFLLPAISLATASPISCGRTTRPAKRTNG